MIQEHRSTIVPMRFSTIFSTWGSPDSRYHQASVLFNLRHEIGQEHGLPDSDNTPTPRSIVAGASKGFP
jgi:hypothetical protein